MPIPEQLLPLFNHPEARQQHLQTNKHSQPAHQLLLGQARLPGSQMASSRSPHTQLSTSKESFQTFLESICPLISFPLGTPATTGGKTVPTRSVSREQQSENYLTHTYTNQSQSGPRKHELDRPTVDHSQSQAAYTIICNPSTVNVQVLCCLI